MVARAAAELLAQLAQLALLATVAGAGQVPGLRDLQLDPSSDSVGETIRIVKRMAPDLFVGAPGLAQEHGYGMETHRLATEDGYLLTLHRLTPRPGPETGANELGSGPEVGGAALKGPPVLMVHGLLCSSDMWILNGPEQDLAYRLLDSGYDVWLANMRGNEYSKKHVNMTSLHPDFWKFSWHEMGMFDVPASIDYVLNATGHDRLFYVGHSMGNTVFFVMASSRPEYNSKVRLQVSLAPGVFFLRFLSPLVRAVLPIARDVARTMEGAGVPELFPLSAAKSALLFLLCRDGALTQPLCVQGLYLAYGPTHPGFNKTRLALYLSHMFGGTSVRTAAHFMQTASSGHFRPWEEASQEANQRRYGRSMPPDYDLSRVTAPTAIFYSEDDYYVHPDDVKRLARALPRVVKLHCVTPRPFNHIDFALSPSAGRLLYDPAMEIMQKH